MMALRLSLILSICFIGTFCHSRNIANDEKNLLEVIDIDEVRQAECKDKDEKYCISYVRIYANSTYKICEQKWFISDAGRYGCKKSCNLCDNVERVETTLEPRITTLEPKTCEDKDAKFCPSYVRIYKDRFCKQSWFISDSGRYGCKKSCNLCDNVVQVATTLEPKTTTLEPKTTTLEPKTCEDKDAKFCPSYVRIYKDRFCKQSWFISDAGRYGCKKSCNLCDNVVKVETTLEPKTTTLEPKTCEDKDAKFCPSYVRIYGDRFCKQSWFISDAGRYGCKKSCKLCDNVEQVETTLEPKICEDKDAKFCPSYVKIYGDRFCKQSWFISDDGKYGCKQSCNLC